MNSTIASNINNSIHLSNGKSLNQHIGSHTPSSVLASRIEFHVTENKTNYSVPLHQGRYLYKLSGKGHEELLNGQKKHPVDQNKNCVEDGMPSAKIQLFTGQISMEWKQVYKIGAGLNNLGNTCFMNTVIQCLTYCPPLANYLLHDSNHLAKCTITGFCMMCLLQTHMKRAMGKAGDVIKPVEVYQRLKLIAKHFQFGRQEDAHEFLRYVVDNLWRSCLANYGGKLDPASKETTVINEIFGGYHRSQVVCLQCKERSNTFDHFMDFILDIKQNVLSLEKALDRFTQPELLQEENAYKCPRCKGRVSAQKRFTVHRAPNVATFQLKRFDYHRSFGGKITKQVSYPERLNLRPYMSEPRGDAVWYRLNAVLVHSGASCNAGHYYCYVRNSNGFWYIMDDQKVYQVSLNQVLNQIAYVLFYVRTVSPAKVGSPARPAFQKGIKSPESAKPAETKNGLVPYVSSDEEKKLPVKATSVWSVSEMPPTHSSRCSSKQGSENGSSLKRGWDISRHDSPKSLENGNKWGRPASSRSSSPDYEWVERTKETIEHQKGKSSNVASELSQNSCHFYGAPVPTWTGGVHMLPPQEKLTFDHYDDDLDRGRVRKNKKRPFHSRYNPFSRHQEERNYPRFKWRREWRPKWRHRKYYSHR